MTPAERSRRHDVQERGKGLPEVIRTEVAWTAVDVVAKFQKIAADWKDPGVTDHILDVLSAEIRFWLRYRRDLPKAPTKDELKPPPKT